MTSHLVLPLPQPVKPGDPVSLNDRGELVKGHPTDKNYLGHLPASARIVEDTIEIPEKWIFRGDVS